MLPPVIIIIGGPRPNLVGDGFSSTMGVNAVEATTIDIQCQDESLGFAEQAALLRAAADQLDRRLDPPALETASEV